MNTNWNDNNFCMAVTNTSKKCSFKSSGTHDFCKKHTNGQYDIATLTKIKNNDMKKFSLTENDVSVKSFGILNKYYSDLDAKFYHNLLGIYDSWNDVELKNHIKVDKEYWPVDILLNHFSQQLNNSTMELQYPIYPTNPYTRQTFSVDALLKIKNRIKLLKIRVNVALKVFLNLPEKTLTQIYKDAMCSQNRHSHLLTRHLETYLRFKLINCKNSQFNYVGYWVRKTLPTSPFEMIYKDYRNAPYQMYDRYHDMIINNPYRIRIEKTINDMQPEIFDISNCIICELL